jgi:hypothetical protein
MLPAWSANFLQIKTLENMQHVIMCNVLYNINNEMAVVQTCVVRTVSATRCLAIRFTAPLGDRHTHSRVGSSAQHPDQTQWSNSRADDCTWALVNAVMNIMAP